MYLSQILFLHFVITQKYCQQGGLQDFGCFFSASTRWCYGETWMLLSVGLEGRRRLTELGLDDIAVWMEAHWWKPLEIFTRFKWMSAVATCSSRMSESCTVNGPNATVFLCSYLIILSLFPNLTHQNQQIFLTSVNYDKLPCINMMQPTCAYLKWAHVPDKSA